MGKRIEDDFMDEVKDFEKNPDDGEVIKNSLEKIKYQTSKHLCINTGLSIESVLEWLDSLSDSRIILTQVVGSTIVYFLAKNEPKGKPYLGGNNTVLVREIEDAPADPNAPKIGDRVVLEKSAPTLDQTEKQILRISAETVEDLAAEGLTQARIAARLGIGFSTLTLKLRNDAGLFAAYQNGREAWMIKQDSAAEKPKPEQTSPAPAEKVNFAEAGKIPDALATANSREELAKITNAPANSIDWTTEKLYQLAKDYGSYSKAADSLGMHNTTVRYQVLRNSENLQAWQRGKDEFYSRKKNFQENHQKKVSPKTAKNGKS